MNLNTTLRLSGAAMGVARTRLNVTASNLANAETTRTPEGGPYKRRVVQVEARRLLDSEGHPVGRALGTVLREPVATQVSMDQRPARLVYDPTHPDANDDGYVAMPNIEVVEEMVNMIAANRAYTAAASAIQTVKTMAQRALDIAT
jgi:flagellar basal-body rod protein FlgC